MQNLEIEVTKSDYKFYQAFSLIVGVFIILFSISQKSFACGGGGNDSGPYSVKNNFISNFNGKSYISFHSSSNTGNSSTLTDSVTFPSSNTSQLERFRHGDIEKLLSFFPLSSTERTNMIAEGLNNLVKEGDLFLIPAINYVLSRYSISESDMDIFKELAERVRKSPKSAVVNAPNSELKRLKEENLKLKGKVEGLMMVCKRANASIITSDTTAPVTKILKSMQSKTSNATQM